MPRREILSPAQREAFLGGEPVHNGLKLRCSASTVSNACDRDDLVSVVNPVNEAVRTDDGFADKGVLFLRNHPAALGEKRHGFCLLDEFFTKSLSGSGIFLRDEITNAA